ncbi:MAG TPA: thiamine pyrophosphate-binding protein [Azospirillaceae bacterium]|nr:thiamine pyrophosphate-binding protein [Azospirillaceae bacterium]
MLRTGARLLVDALARQGVERVFGVPGESYLAVLDALHDSRIRFVTCRQEGGAAMMAEAAGKLDGRPGICFVTRGPGATNASAGVHVAQQDGTPMILFIGQVARGVRNRGAFQELDYAAVFGTMAKWVVEIDAAERVPELVARAFRMACQGHPGPVVVVLPEDMLSDAVAAPDAPVADSVQPSPDAGLVRECAALLATAERPLVIAGGSGWTETASAALATVAERWALPVAVEFRRQMLLSGHHPCYAGDLGFGPNPALIERVRRSDLLLVLGGALGDVPSQGYTLLGIPDPGVPMVHVHASAEELGKIYQPRLSIQAAPEPFLSALAQLNPSVSTARRDARDAARGAYLAWTDMVPPHPGPVQMAEVMAALRRLPSDSILCNGAGNYAIWLHRFHRYGGFGTQLAPTSGSMGYGVPAAIAAKLRHPKRPVIALAGDGCFLMHGQEFATAVQHGAAIVVVVIDNGMYGTIRMHQEREYPGRVSGTMLKSPDFALLARSCGGEGYRVDAPGAFVPALEAALAGGVPSLIHVHLDPQAITPTGTLDGIRASALGR